MRRRGTMASPTVAMAAQTVAPGSAEGSRASAGTVKAITTPTRKPSVGGGARTSTSRAAHARAAEAHLALCPLRCSEPLAEARAEALLAGGRLVSASAPAAGFPAAAEGGANGLGSRAPRTPSCVPCGAEARAGARGGGGGGLCLLEAGAAAAPPRTLSATTTPGSRATGRARQRDTGGGEVCTPRTGPLASPMRWARRRRCGPTAQCTELKAIV
mmetsp:Transcript_25945/g.70156  ORF Transcript_25945/g.70156 Transcript_25945/m.70156 type:complete len:215 (+) Transcript_25945:1191-1835(+)